MGPRIRDILRHSDCVPFVEMRGLVLAAGLLLAPAAYAQNAEDTARVLDVTLADLDEDSMDFLIGWERWKGDILDLASEGYARFTFVPLVAIAPGLPADGRFGGWGLRGWGLEAAVQRALPRSARARRPARTRSPRPVRIARAPRGRPAPRARPRPPRGLAPPAFGASHPPPRTRGARDVPRRGPAALGGSSRGGKRTGAASGSTGRARPRSPGARSRGASGTRNTGDLNSRRQNPRGVRRAIHPGLNSRWQNPRGVRRAIHPG